jgi:hypothetical protein
MTQLCLTTHTSQVLCKSHFPETLFLIGIFVSHVSVWFGLCNGYIQFNYLFPTLTRHSQTGSQADKILSAQ